LGGQIITAVEIRFMMIKYTPRRHNYVHGLGHVPKGSIVQLTIAVF